MRVIFASDTPVLPEESRFQVGSAEDEYRIERQWRVPIKPRLEMEDGDQPSDWAIVSKILTRVSWTMWMDVGLWKTSENKSSEGYIYLPNREGNDGPVKGFLHLFGVTIFDTTPLLKIKLGASNPVQFDSYYFCEDDDDDDDRPHGGLDKKLTESEALKLLMVEDKDVRITWEESFESPEADALSPCARILNTGYFADCRLVSNQGHEFPCHQVILKEHGAKFEEEMVNGNRRIEVDLSTAGVGALLRFLYYGALDDDIGNWKRTLELLKVAHSHGVRKLWDAVVDVLMGVELEPEIKTAAEVFQVLVNAGKLETNKDLGRKLFRLLAKKSAVSGGDCAILHEYIRDRPFFEAWIGFISAA